MKFNRTALLLLLICSLPVSGMTADIKAVVQEQSANKDIKPEPSTPAKNIAPVAKKIRLGYVDVAKIGSESDLGKQYANEAKQKQQKFQDQIESRKKQLEKQKKTIEAKIASMTPAQRESKGKEFQKKVEEFQKFGLNAEKELFSFQEQLSKSMIEEVEKAAAEYGKSDGLALVVVKQEMFYLSGEVDSIDITSGVIKIMNANKKNKK
jgi:outer membrane protein